MATATMGSGDILIEGVGSVGGVVAGELLARGHALTLVTGNPQIAAAIEREGLRLHTPERSLRLPARAVSQLDELPATARFDAAYLLMMAGAVEAAATATLPWLRDEGYFVAFQNGFVEDRLSACCGAGRIISACVAFGANMEAPGDYRHTTGGHIFIGELDGSVSPRLERLQQTLAGVIETRVSSNILGVLWSKLAWNCAVSALCAVSGLVLGEVIAREDGQSLLLISYREALDTARANGIRLERVVVDHENLYLPRGAPAAVRAEKQARVGALARHYAGVKPSALQSLLRGRRTEIDHLNGFLVRQGRALGLELPLNAALTAMVVDIEHGRRPIDPANLDELYDFAAALL